MKLSCVTAVLAFVAGSLALPNMPINNVLVERDGGEVLTRNTDYVIPIDKRDENPATDYVIPIDKRDDSPATDYVIPIDKREEPGADPGGDSPAIDYVIPIDK
ncbi:hypothetical protein GCG54_00012732 [Colletotrichum gloeosporioides]|uniref:Uncharacterized protein n=1 Tax=Colletotrichum gloeosporioides TaxID=474922 RepID=A0A8H4FPE6_COLGL|nr:uncharacterized protein GCG54_00012732 [Colletotrichum gloeosporioides]KAF3809451.1 hypothetical protein GCG54_00012732 [Colletotrichum gloeosporioides]